MIKKGFVYLLCDGEKFKIGMTRQKNLQKRIKELQTGNPNEIYVSSYYETNYPYSVEQMIHVKYKPSCVKNEWFDLNAKQVVEFRNNCKKCEMDIEVLKDNPFFVAK